MTSAKEGSKSDVRAVMERSDAAMGSIEDTPLARDERLLRALESEVHKLVDEFEPLLPRSVVEMEFTSCVRTFDSARIRMYVPVLSYRNARQALRQMAIDVASKPKRAA